MEARREGPLRTVSWERAFRIIADKLNGLDSPDQASFYTSGRTSNEAAFVYQLFVRAFGTNNLPDCSNMCHESTSLAMAETVGIGKSTIAYDDFEETELIIVMARTPARTTPACSPRSRTPSGTAPRSSR